MINFIISSILCSISLILFYKLILENTTNHRFKRFFLILIIVLPSIIPSLKFKKPEAELNNISNIVLTENTFTKMDQFSESIDLSKASFLAEDFSIYYILLSIYFLGFVIFLIRFMYNLGYLISMKNRSQVIYYQGIKLVVNDKIESVFSFLNFIFINKSTFDKSGINPCVTAHELAHVNQKHSFDIIIFEVNRIVFWFNPFMGFLKQFIQLNHEYLADESVLKSFSDVKSYQLLLLEESSTQANYLFTSNFNYLFTKKRLIMMTKKSSFKNKILKVSLSILAILVSGYYFSSKTNAQSSTISTKNGKDEKVVIKFTTEGISEEEFKKYNNLVSSKPSQKKYKIPDVTKFSKEELEYLESTFYKMTQKQQRAGLASFIPNTGPLPANGISKKEFESLKNPEIYGVWVDGKHVDNTVLNKYKSEDFSQYYKSKLYGKAKIGRNYKFQVDLITHKDYEKYIKEYNSQEQKSYMYFKIRS